jgi:hypothetical protein
MHKNKVVRLFIKSYTSGNYQAIVFIQTSIESNHKYNISGALVYMRGWCEYEFWSYLRISVDSCTEEDRSLFCTVPPNACCRLTGCG